MSTTEKVIIKRQGRYFFKETNIISKTAVEDLERGVSGVRTSHSPSGIRVFASRSPLVVHFKTSIFGRPTIKISILF